MDDHDRGLAFDLATMRQRGLDEVRPLPVLMDRRRALRSLGGVALLALVGCGSSRATTDAATASSSAATTGALAGSTTTAGGSCAVIPEETGGPFPGDGTNGPNALDQNGIVRSDIRASFGSSTTVAPGVPLTVVLTVKNQAKACAAYAGAAVYLWHCDREGRYSLYDRAITNENYLRGVQEAGADGVVTFRTIFPAAYSGRWPHIHFEVFPTLSKAVAGVSKVRTSQLALPEAACKVVYATSGYEQSVTNLARTSLATDMVFSDGASLQTPTYEGGASGMTIKLDVVV